MDKQALTRVDILISTNVWWDDNFQFGDPNDQTWNLNGFDFYLDLKVNEDDHTPALALSSVHGTITVVDAGQRILAMNVSDGTIRASLAEGTYSYDLIMVDQITGKKDGMMYGTVQVATGITVEP